MQQPSEEIKGKLDIVEVIREYIQLKAAGINFRSTCPFHREKTPSFMVSPEKQIWHCFGCGKGGDVFSFIMEIEGISFVEALRQLAVKAGVTLKRADPGLTSQRNRLLDIMELAAKFYHKILLNRPEATRANQYLKQRALTEETINAWQIGYSPKSWDALMNFLKDRGYSENEIFLAGLSVKKENRPSFYDRFRDRIMFPLNDLSGNVVGFSARILPPEAEGLKPAEEKLGKYINTPQTMIYNKSGLLFGLDKAKLSIKQDELAVIVEGQMDVITAYQAGFTNIIASSGTSLTAEQVAIIKRYTPNIILAFDMDKAGDLAAERGIVQAMQAEMNIKVLEVPGGKDPDECIRQNPDQWKKAITEAKPMMQYYFNKTLAEFPPVKLENKSRAIKILLPVIIKLGNKVEQDFWLKNLSQVTDVDEKSLREEYAKIEKKDNYKTPAPKENLPKDGFLQIKQTREEMLSELLLGLIIKYPSHIDFVANHLGPDVLVDEFNQIVYKSLIVYYNKIIDSLTDVSQIDLTDQKAPSEINPQTLINYNDFRNWLDENELASDNQSEAGNNQLPRDACLSRLDRVVFLADKDFYDYSQEQAKNEIINILTILKRNYLSKRLKEVAKLIALIEKENSPDNQALDQAKLKTLLEEFIALNEEMKQMEY